MSKFYAVAEAPSLKNLVCFLEKLSDVKYVKRCKNDKFNNSLYRLSSTKNNGQVCFIMVTRCNNQLIPSVLDEIKKRFKDAKFNV